MRKVVFAAILVMLCSAAFAGEVVLEKQANKSGRPLAYFKTEMLKYQKTAAPEGAKAPEGDLEWGRLIVGKRSYAVCITVEEKKLTKLYLDGDADNDFAEETPAKLKGNFITIEGMPVEFEVVGGTLIDKTNISILQYSPRNGYVGISTRYGASAEVEGKKVRIDWVPGQKPRLFPEGQRQGFAAYYFGKKKLALEGDNVALKDGRLVANCLLKEEEGLVEMAAGSFLQQVTLHQGRDGAACIPEEGKVYLPKGTYTAAFAYFTKKVDSDTYNMRVLLGNRNFQIDDDSKVGDVEPLTLRAAIYPRGDKVTVRASLTCTTGGSVSLTKNNRSLPPPKLIIKDAEGKEVATHVFKPG